MPIPDHIPAPSKEVIIYDEATTETSNKEKLLRKQYLKKYLHEYYTKNKEKMSANAKTYYQNNLEKIKEYANKYNIENKAKVDAYQKMYREKNKEKFKEERKIRLAKKKQVIITNTERGLL